MPTNDTLFLTTQYIMDNTVLNGNVDPELVEPFILTSQNVRIERVLGTGLFDEIAAQIAAGTVSAVNKILLDKYILPALKEWVVYEALPFLNYKLTNKSVAKKGSDNSVPSDLSEVQYLRSSVRDIAEYLTTRITAFLKENNSTYPLYQNPGTGCDVIRPNSNNYFNGIYLED